MSKKQNILTPKQRRANARNQLFYKIHGYNIKKFIDIATKENAITKREFDVLCQITMKLEFLKRHQFQNSKILGFNPNRRCTYCNNIAHYRATIIGTDYYLCNKHKNEVEKDNKQNINDEWMITDIHEINPYE